MSIIAASVIHFLLEFLDNAITKKKKWSVKTGKKKSKMMIFFFADDLNVSIRNARESIGAVTEYSKIARHKISVYKK